jgi:hypothetical protein
VSFGLLLSRCCLFPPFACRYDDRQLMKTFSDASATLRKAMTGVEAFLDAQRVTFPRFCLLAVDDILDLLSVASAPKEASRAGHVRKCFPGVDSLVIEDVEPDGLGDENAWRITGVRSARGEVCPIHAVPASTPLRVRVLAGVCLCCP